MNNYKWRSIKNKNVLWKWAAMAMLLLLIIFISVYRLKGVSKVPPGKVNVKESSNEETNNTKKAVRASRVPSLDTLNQIDEWIREDAAQGEEFSSYNYALTQYYGIHIGMADMVLTQIHSAMDLETAEKVITLLDSFSYEFENTMAALGENEKSGAIPPKFIITQVEEQLEDFMTGSVKENSIYLAFNKRLQELGFNSSDRDKLLKKLEKVLKDKIYIRYTQILRYFEGLEAKSTDEAGVWRLEDGDKYYAYMLRHNTTLDMKPQEVYDLGMREIDKIQRELQVEFKKLGYSGTLSENMFSLNNDQNFLYSMDKHGEEQIIKDYEGIIGEMNLRMGEFFDAMPQAGLKVMPIMEHTEESGPQAYYYPSMEGEEPGIFYVNVQKPTYKYDMQSIAYHEGVPGHHLQMALQRELLGEEYPDKSSYYIPAYVEGWGLYAEKLADEYDMYKDSYSRLGYLRGELLRAVRLVVDTGIHYKKWTREYAIEYMRGFGCIPDEFVETEVDRYIVSPGQACSYKIGQLKILELRDKARIELGEKFNIKDFHNVILRNGPMPFEIMEREVEKYIAEVK